MTLVQMIMLVLASYATFYQVFKLIIVHGVIAQKGDVRISVDLYIVWAITVLIQVVFVLSLTGVII